MRGWPGGGTSRVQLGVEDTASRALPHFPAISPRDSPWDQLFALGFFLTGGEKSEGFVIVVFSRREDMCGPRFILGPALAITPHQQAKRGVLREASKLTREGGAASDDIYVEAPTRKRAKPKMRGTVARATAPSLGAGRKHEGDASDGVDSEDGDPQLTRIKHHNVILEETIALEDVIRMVSGDLKRAIVQEESPTPSAPAIEQESQRHRASLQQLDFVRKLSRGVCRFDPAQDRGAWQKWKHLARSLDVEMLRHTHGGSTQVSVTGHILGKASRASQRSCC